MAIVTSALKMLAVLLGCAEDSNIENFCMALMSLVNLTIEAASPCV
jgi:hypothetical protein